MLIYFTVVLGGGEMFSIGLLIRHSFLRESWRGGQLRASLLPASRRMSISCRRIPCSVNGSSASPGYDPAKELLELEVDPHLRNDMQAEAKERSWFGPNGQYIRELPCPSCRGRGYRPCPDCGVERSRADCSHCNGKGVKTCWQCLGECVIWEELYDEGPWEKARSSSLFKVKEDDEVDSLEIKVDASRKSKRVYGPPTPEVSLKISRSLRNLNAKTGLFSMRMKIIHQDPILHAQRVAAIKKTKGTPAARKRASEISKAYFSDPVNRLQRSMAMKGVKFYCSHCGEEGHRRHYCQALIKTSGKTRFKCSLCGKKGHNRRTCGKAKRRNQSGLRHCKLCGQSGHYQATCSLHSKMDAGNDSSDSLSLAKVKRSYSCKVCLGKGHNSRTCPNQKN